MAEFTKDDIEHYRKQYDLWTSRIQTTPAELLLIDRLRGALDHIEHLQKRVQELEVHNKDFHLACINALDLHRESDVPKLKDIPNIIEEIRERNQKLEIQLKSKDIIINNQQGRLNYYATKDLLGGKNEQ
jgi:hypothetical protein